MYHKEFDVRMWTGLIWLKKISNVVFCVSIKADELLD
jgi:hypothetical protein